MNRFFIRLIGGFIAGTAGFLNSANALQCTTSGRQTGGKAYYKTVTCPAREVYQTDINKGNFPGSTESGNQYVYQDQNLIYKDISVPSNGTCIVKNSLPIAKGLFIIPCNQNQVAFSSSSLDSSIKTKTCSEHLAFDSSSGEGCLVDDSGILSAVRDDFFKAYGGCFCESGLSCYDAGSGSGSDSGSSCEFYYYKTTYGSSSYYLFDGCKPGYYPNKTVGSGETFAYTSSVDSLCSPCSGMRYKDGTVSTFTPSAGVTGENGVWWKSNGTIGINSCYANREINDGAGVFSFESDCTYGS